MHIAVASQHDSFRVVTPEVRRFANWLAKNIPELDAPKWAGISIVITNDEGIAAVNEKFLKHRGPTDVITFTLPPPPGVCGMRGEIYVNAERARKEAKRRRGDPSRELAFYIAHGFDHLCGFDDRTPAMRARMHKRERAWLRAAPATEFF